jgi:hypothetical protein
LCFLPLRALDAEGLRQRPDREVCLKIEEWRVLSSEILTWVDDNVPIILRVLDVLRVSQSIAGGTGDACVTIGSVVIA